MSERGEKRGRYDWRPKVVLIPRFAYFVSRAGAGTRLILPGKYFVRKSRTTGKTVYRRA